MQSKNKNLFFVKKNKKVLFLFGQKKGEGKFNLKLSESSDGLNFKPMKKKLTLKNKKIKKDTEKCQNFRITKLGKEYLLTYKKNSLFNKIIGAVSSDLINWKILDNLKGIKNADAIVSDFFYDEDRVMYTGAKNIDIAYSKDLVKWRIEKKSVLTVRCDHFDNHKLIPGSAFSREEGIALFYFHKSINNIYSIGLAIFNKDNPEELIKRNEEPLWTQEGAEKIKPLCIIEINNNFIAYFEASDGQIMSIVLPPVLIKQKSIKITLKKSENNPIMSPIKDNAWESVAAFNPTVFEHDGKVHVLYRAMGHDALSTIGYAVSNDGININKRFSDPIYIPRESFEGVSGGEFVEGKTPKYMSGSGWGGCEDARVTIINNKVYILYAAFNGYSDPNIAISSIPLKDFLNKKWTNWEKPALITNSLLSTKNPKATKMTRADRPNQKYTGEKDAAILPEKVNGKYVIFHRIWPNIVIDFVDDLNFDGKKFLRGEYMIKVRPDMWDSAKICLAATPLKIKEGWLLIYNAVDKKDSSKYKIGAMILDHKDPTKVLYRCSQPILEPEEHYENGGLKYGIVFGGGALIKNGTLYVYYGSSDEHTCIATHNLKDFIKKLKEDAGAKLTQILQS